MTGQTPTRTRDIARLYLDFDSFFATAEQHFNPALRDRPVGVVPLDSPNTTCIAISREAKARGLKGMASIADARKLIPEMQFVVARHDVYVRLHDRIIEVIESCLPIAQVRSIDEVVCELKPSEAAEGLALGERIKAALQAAFGDVLTCSIGMAPTELLAKIAAEDSKPDGLALLNGQDLPGKLYHLKLQKLPGISDGIEGRLTAAGVADFAGLWRLAPKQARAIWGNVEGERFWNGLHGYHSERPATQKRMFGHSRILLKDWQTSEKIAVCTRQLCLSAARRVRRAELKATKLTLSMKGGGYRGRRGATGEVLKWSHEVAFPPACDDKCFLDALNAALTAARGSVSFRAQSVGVVLHGLQDPLTVTGDLFDLPHAAQPERDKRAERQKWERVSVMLDNLRARLGPEAITLGPQTEIPGGYLGAKIVFGRIPDRADFNQAPVADDDTHFCSF